MDARANIKQQTWTVGPFQELTLNKLWKFGRRIVKRLCTYFQFNSIKCIIYLYNLYNITFRLTNVIPERIIFVSRGITVLLVLHQLNTVSPLSLEMRLHLVLDAWIVLSHSSCKIQFLALNDSKHYCPYEARNTITLNGSIIALCKSTIHRVHLKQQLKHLVRYVYVLMRRQTHTLTHTHAHSHSRAGLKQQAARSWLYRQLLKQHSGLGSPTHVYIMPRPINSTWKWMFLKKQTTPPPYNGFASLYIRVFSYDSLSIAFSF